MICQKKILIPISILLLLTNGFSKGEKKSLESCVPESAVFFVKTSSVLNIVENSKFIIKKFISKEQNLKIQNYREIYKNVTGIDFLSPESLKKTGIEIYRSIGFALFAEKKENESLMILIPVRDEKKFPLKFIRIIKNLGKNKKNLDLNPVITPYKGNKIFQIERDIFFTTVNGYLIVANSGSLIRNVIELDSAESTSLETDPLFQDYTHKGRHDFVLNVFAKRQFLNEVVSAGLKKMEILKNQKRGLHTSAKTQLEKIQYFYANQLNENLALNKNQSFNSFKSVDYVSFGFGLDPKLLKFNFSSKFNFSDPLIGMILGFIKTGMSERALFQKEFSSYGYFSIDLKYLEKICSNSISGCELFKSFKKDVNGKFGIDVSKDVLPYYSGVVNAIMGKGQGAGVDHYVFFLPMNSAEKSSQLWKKIRENFKEKSLITGQSGRFGNEKIHDMMSFWFMDETNVKTYYLSDKRGFYLSSSADDLKKAVRNIEIGNIQDGNVLLRKMQDDIFFLSYIKRNSFLSRMLQFQATGDQKVINFINKIGDVYLIGGKKGSFVSLDLDMEILNKNTAEK